MHQHHPHAQQGEGDQVVHHGGFQLFVYHGVAAVLHHQSGAVVFLDVGGRLAEQLGHLFVLHRYFLLLGTVCGVRNGNRR